MSKPAPASLEMALAPSAGLKSLVLDPAVGISAIGQYLDGLPHGQRLAEVQGLNRGAQRALYQKAAQGAALALTDLVPEQLSAGEPVVHYGKNTLPVPGFLQRFEKRFCRPQDGSERLFGYNEGLTRPFIGPGYFVLVPTRGKAEWEPRGTLVVDYFQVPDGPVASGWPRVVPNSRGLQFFVFHKTRDFLRRVSRHVSIGAAYKVEKSLDHYFTLVREPTRGEG